MFQEGWSQDPWWSEAGVSIRNLCLHTVTNKSASISWCYWSVRRHRYAVLIHTCMHSSISRAEYTFVCRDIHMSTWDMHNVNVQFRQKECILCLSRSQTHFKHFHSSYLQVLQLQTCKDIRRQMLKHVWRQGPEKKDLCQYKHMQIHVA